MTKPKIVFEPEAYQYRLATGWAAIVWVRRDGEIVGSRIGPDVRATADEATRDARVAALRASVQCNMEHGDIADFRAAQ